MVELDLFVLAVGEMGEGNKRIIISLRQYLVECTGEAGVGVERGYGAEYDCNGRG